MSPALLTLLTFIAAVCAVVGIYSLVSDLFLRDRERISQRVDQEFRQQQRDLIRRTDLFRNLGKLSAEAAEEDRPSLRLRFNTIIEQSALRITPDRLLVIMVAVGTTTGGLVWLIRKNPLLGVAVGLVFGAVPFLYVLLKRNARLEKMTLQLPDAFEMMSRVIRAGQTITQAQKMVADEFDQPLAGEFAYCYEQQDLGLTAEVALRDLARRTGLLEIKIFVLALLVQQQSGGNLAELLDKLGHMIRERFRVRGKIKAITAEGRLQAVVLLVLPIALMIVLAIGNSQYAAALSAHPDLIIAMLVAEAVGALWIRKIVNIDI